MKKVVIFLILLNLSQLFAGNHFSIKYGINNSVFYNDNNSSFSRGYSLGINYEYSFFKSYYIGIGLFYSKVAAWLNNKKVYVRQSRTLWLENIHVGVGYLKLPLRIGYLIPLNKNLRIKFLTGFSILALSKDYTDKNIKYMIEEDIPLNKKFEYDYYFVGMDESVFPMGDYSHSSINWGISIVYKNVCSDLIFDYQLGHIGTFDNISKIRKSLFTIEVLFGLEF